MDNNAEDIKLYDHIVNNCFPRQEERSKITKKDEKNFINKKREYQFSTKSLVKRKLSNLLLSKLIQPSIQ